MPAAYRFLRVRLRIEQSRLLRWGEKVGLAEEFLDNPSRVLQLNRNLIFDILLEIQALFKKTVKIQAKFGSLVLDKDLPDCTQPAMQTSETSFLKNTLNSFNKLLQVPMRLQWSLIKHEQFKVWWRNSSVITTQLKGYSNLELSSNFSTSSVRPI